MKRDSLMKYLPASALLLAFVGGCTAVIGSPPARRVVVAESKKPGPPPWAPAHGYRRKHEKYYYYPVAQVYYYPSTRRYLWLDGGDWKVGVRLPTRLVLAESERVELELDYEPHKHHAVIKSKYPPDYFVKEKKGKGRGKGRKWD